MQNFKRCVAKKLLVLTGPSSRHHFWGDAQLGGNSWPGQSYSGHIVSAGRRSTVEWNALFQLRLDSPG